jgi:hypothetical protein
MIWFNRILKTLSPFWLEKPRGSFVGITQEGVVGAGVRSAGGVVRSPLPNNSRELSPHDGAGRLSRYPCLFECSSGVKVTLETPHDVLVPGNIEARLTHMWCVCVTCPSDRILCALLVSLPGLVGASRFVGLFHAGLLAIRNPIIVRPGSVLTMLCRSYASYVNRIGPFVALACSLTASHSGANGQVPLCLVYRGHGWKYL